MKVQDSVLSDLGERRTCLASYPRTCIHIHPHSTHTHVHNTHTHTHTHTHIHTHTHTHTNKDIYAFTQHTHVLSRAHTHAHTHSLKHTCKDSLGGSNDPLTSTLTFLWPRAAHHACVEISIEIRVNTRARPWVVDISRGQLIMPA